MTWEQRLQQLIAPGANKFPYRVVQVKPNRKIDEEIYTLSGREEDIAANGSLFLALYDMAQRDRPDFEKWFQQWELGFPQFNNDRATSNFALAGETQWKRIKEPETRPRYRELTNSQQRADLGYRVIEYWRDRSDEKNSIILGGVTDLMLIDRILAYEYQNGGIDTSRKLLSYENSNKGLPLISLYFEQDSDKVNKYISGKPYSPLQGEISLRIVDKSEDPESPLEKLTKADIKRYAEKIKVLFGENDGYLWEKGRKIVSYNKPSHGFKRTWYMCKNHAIGIALLGKLTQIIDKPLDRSRITKNEIEDEFQRFAEKQPLVILGETVEQEQERSIGDVRFKYADLYLSKARKTLRLVTGSTINYT